MNKGASIYKKKNKLILGGNMILSKNPEMILPDYWPTYYSKSRNSCLVARQYQVFRHDVLCRSNTLGYSNSFFIEK